MNQYDYGMRVYDPRIGQFLSVDPLARSFPWNSPYSYTEGNPINYLDLDGMETTINRGQASATRTGTVVEVKVSRRPPRRSSITVTSPVPDADYVSPTIKNWPADFNYQPYVAPNSQEWQATITDKGVYVDGITHFGRSYRNVVYEVPEPGEITWVSRLLLGQFQENLRLFNSFQQWNTSIQALETITNDPTTLPDEYLSEVQRRLINGNATAQDKLYQGELKRRKQLYELNDKHNPAKPLGGANASVMPDNHLQLWESRSHYDATTDTWWSVEGSGKKAVFHRFMGGDGTYHWSGSTGNNVNRNNKPVKPIRIQDVPIELRRKAGKTK